MDLIKSYEQQFGNLTADVIYNLKSIIFILYTLLR